MNNSEHSNQPLDKYTDILDFELQNVFDVAPDLEMYRHMAYFMGFADENLALKRSYGGKRFRSKLTLLLGDCYGILEKVVPAAVSIELFHNSTLIHDDIVDGDTLRRGRPTVWKLVGKDHAINSGDAQILMSLRPVLNNEILEDSVKVGTQSFLLNQYIKVAEGQFLDFKLTEAKLGDDVVTKEAYRDMIGRKTADLVAASSGVVGILAGLSDIEKKTLIEFGFEFGLAYQMCDDLVSIWGTSKQTGKREYGDILECKKTLPILWWIDQASDEDKKVLLEIYNSSDEVTVDQAKRVVDMLDKADTYNVVMNEIDAKRNKINNLLSTLSIAEDKKNLLLNIVEELLIDIKTV